MPVDTICDFGLRARLIRSLSSCTTSGIFPSTISVALAVLEDNCYPLSSLQNSLVAKPVISQVGCTSLVASCSWYHYKALLFTLSESACCQLN